MRLRVITFLTALILAFTSTLSGKNAEDTFRKFHDSYIGSSLCDTAVMLCAPSKNASSKAIEIRANSATKNRADVAKSYGITWGISVDGSMYQALISSNSGTDNDDIFNTPSVTLTIKRVNAANQSQILKTVSLNKNIDTEQCHNVLAAEIDCHTGHVDILAGKNMPVEVASIDISPVEAQLGLGIVAIGCPTFDLIVSEQIADKTANLKTQWNVTNISQYLSQITENTIEGYWQYLDRDNDSKYCRLGGKYALAIIANQSDGYDIIYLNGAEISASKWEQGMIKGHLKPTKFHNHYNLIWYDSMFNALSNECSATMESDNIIRLDFPLLNSSIRLSKQ